MAKSEKKVFLEYDHDLKTAVQLLIQNAAEKVILNIPRNSVLGSKLNNFWALKKECAGAGKELLIESVDDHILELAALAGIAAVNPVFRVREKVIADILPRSSFRQKEAAPQKVVAEKPVFEEAALKKRAPLNSPEREESVPSSFGDFRGKSFNYKTRTKAKVNFRKTFAVLIVVLLGFVGAFALAIDVLPKATIILTLKKMPVDFAENVEISSNTASPNFEGGKIVLPGEFLSASKNMEMSFPAVGKETVAVKARGTLVVYNSFSAALQSLVKNTRFESPDGKIFRIEKNLVIPGAEVGDGKIMASKIEVEVVADEPGESYNVGLSSDWRIPGFKGTAKYAGFYAEATRPFSGGFEGERAAANKEDLEQAKIKIEEALRNALESQMLVLMKDRFKLIDGATEFKLLKVEMQSASSSDDKVSVFAEAEMKKLVFEEETLKKAIAEKAKSSITSEPARINKFELNYGSPQIDLAAGKMILPVNGSLVFEPDIDQNKILERVLGLNEANLKEIIFSLPGLEKANVSLWPFWVKKVPSKTQKIKIVVE